MTTPNVQDLEYTYGLTLPHGMRAQLERQGNRTCAALGAALNMVHGLPLTTPHRFTVTYGAKIAVDVSGPDFPISPPQGSVQVALLGAWAAAEMLLGYDSWSVDLTAPRETTN